MSDTKLTFAQKVSIVYKLICGDTIDSIAAEFNRTVDEINFISQHHWSIVEVSHFFNNVNHMPVKGGLYPLMENILFCWYVEQRKVTNKQLADKAKVILEVLNEQPRYTPQNARATPFTASKGWINGFKARFKIATPSRKSTTLTTETDTVSSVRVDGEGNSNSESSPEESENFTTVERWSDEEEMKNDEDMGKAFKSDLEANNIEPSIEQQSSDCNNIVADNSSDAVNGKLVIESVVAPSRSAGQHVQDDECSDMAATEDSACDNLKINSVVSLAVKEVNQSSTDKHPLIDSNSDLKIMSVISLAEQGVQNVDNASEIAQVNQDSNDLREFNKSVVSLSQESDRSRNVNSSTPKFVATIDLTESDDERTPHYKEYDESPASKKRKRAVNITRVLL